MGDALTFKYEMDCSVNIRENVLPAREKCGTAFSFVTDQEGSDTCRYDYTPVKA